MTTMLTRQHLRLTTLLSVLLVVPPLTALAQQLVGSGHSLDNNLRLGSGGYNSVGRGGIAGRGTLNAPRYSVTTEQRAMSNERMAWVDRNTAFHQERYDANRPAPVWGAQSPRQPAANGSGARPIVIEAGGAGAVAAAQGDQAQRFPVYADEQVELISYGVGYYLGKELLEGLRRDGIDADLAMAFRGFADGLHGHTPMVPEDDLDKILTAVHEEMKRRMARRLVEEDPEFRKHYEVNVAASLAFHDDFANQEGVVTLPDGLQYQVIVPGTGVSPDPTDVVVLNARMTLIDGTEVGNWRETTGAIDDMMVAGRVLLPMMRVGATWKVAIPSPLAYGEAGRPPDIGPNQSLIVEVELLEIQPPLLPPSPSQDEQPAGQR